MVIRWTLVAAGLASVGVATVGTQAPTYFVRSVTVSDLGTLGGGEAQARDINQLGEIVGWSTLPDGRQRAFFYRDARMREVTAGLHEFSLDAWGINARSEIVGSALYEPDWEGRAFYVPGDDPAGFRFLDDELEEGWPSHCRWESVATAIADTGIIVGSAWIDSAVHPTPHECRGAAGVMQWPFATARVERIPGTGGYDESAWDVNDRGDAVGKNWEWGNNGARWSGGVTTIVPPPAASATVGWEGDNKAFGINDRGYVAGGHDGRRLVKGGIWQPFVAASLWSGISPHAISLGTLPTGRVAYAMDVNEQNFAAGYSDTARVVTTKTFQVNDAFLWHKHFGMVALPRLPASRTLSACEAHALNDLYLGSSNEEGWVQVVGFCFAGPSPGARRAVRWDVRIGLR
jgi:probable HAF family extracellular repeat protein